MQSNYVIVLSTVKSENNAEVLAEKIVKKRLAACIQIQRIKSVYRWNDNIENADEYLLIIKTHADLFEKLSEFIKQNHSYEVPEVIQIPITNGSSEYLSWINRSLD